MKKKFVLASFVLTILAMVHFATSNALAKDVGTYTQNGVIVTISPYWKPYSFLDQDGQPTGFLVDYWRKWSEKTAIPVKFRLAPWNETITLVASGECDIQSGLYSNAERRDFLDFSQSIYRSRGVLAIKKSEPRGCTGIYTSPVGVIHGSYEEFALQKKHPEVIIKPYETSENMLQAFVRDDVRAVVADLPTLMSLGGNMGIVNDINICETIYERDMHAGVLKGNDVLLSLVEEGFSQISHGEQQHIRNNWFVAEQQGSTWLKFSVYVAFAILLIIAVVMFWRPIRSKK